MKKKSLLFAMATLIAVSMTACGSSDSTAATTSAEEQSTAAETSSVAADNQDETEDDDNDVNDMAVYEERARAVFNKVDQLFTAMKAGDIDTIVALGDPHDDVVQSLSEVSDSEVAKLILQTIYADLYWEITDNDISDIADFLMQMDQGESYDDNEMDLYMDALAWRWMLDIRHSCLLYFDEGDILPEGFVPESREQAFEILQTGLDNIPVQKMTGITISPIDEDGNFYFLYEDDFLFEHAELERLGNYSDDNMAQYYVSRLMDVITDYEICDTEAKYEENDEVFAEAAKYAVNKDFEGLTDYLDNYCDKNYREKFGSYDDLNDAQKEFVDSCVSDAVVTWADYSSFNANGEEYRKGSLAVYFPHYEAYLDEEVQQFLIDNNVKDDSGILYFSTDDIEDMYGMLLYKYYACIKYAMDYIQ
ncbi:MAG: hypothetical protein ACI4EU_02505 [Butyrivibrio sp.]